MFVKQACSMFREGRRPDRDGRSVSQVRFMLDLLYFKTETFSAVPIDNGLD